jgi:hypothetical protein
MIKLIDKFIYFKIKIYIISKLKYVIVIFFIK